MMPGEVVIEPKESAPITCLGCENRIPWDGIGMFAYTCPCGATMFHRGSDLIPPASFVTFLANGGQPPKGAKPDWRPPHIDYWLGKSAHRSETKDMLIEGLKRMGCTWSRDCAECSEREREREQALAEYERRSGDGG